MAASIRAGDLLAGRYRMIDLLGETEGGWLWCGHDDVLQRMVAVHLLTADDNRTDELLEAARQSAGITDRRNLRVLDADLDEHVCYVVNEWGHGKSLDLMLEATGPLSPARAAWLVAEVADTLAMAHAAGVSHAHLVPENVLVDENGEVRIIGFAVQAVLHGFSTDRQADDVVQLVSLLYAALTGKWPGPDASTVPPAPTELGKVLRPRQVRAGIPRALDQICDEVLLGGQHSRSLGLTSMLGHRAEHDLTTAAGVRDALTDFLSAHPELAGAHDTTAPGPFPTSTPPHPFGLRPYDDGYEGEIPWGEPSPSEATATRAVDLADTGDVAVEDAEVAEPEGDEADDAGGEPSVDEDVAPERRSGVTEAATEAGMPVFHDDTVEWLRARAHKPAPPPAFEPPPARPLFAPDPPEGTVRPTRPRPTRPHEHDAYWPWDNSHPSSTGAGTGALRAIPDEVPGRNWMRLAWVVGISALVLLLTVAAYHLGAGGGAREPDDDPSASEPSATRSVPSGPLEKLSVTDFDPQGDPPEEYPEQAPLAVDGDASTAWGTQTYEQQFGPGGLKTGVGLVVDVGERLGLRQVQVTVQGGETAAQVFVTDEEPTTVEGLEPVGATAGSDVLTFTFDQTVEGRYVTVWLTKVPKAGDGFRGQVAEIKVFA